MSTPWHILTADEAVCVCVVSRDALDRAQPCLCAAHVFQELLRRGWTEATAACGICVPRTVGGAVYGSPR